MKNHIPNLRSRSKPFAPACAGEYDFGLWTLDFGRSRSAFTLIEVLVVIAVIGILAGFIVAGSGHAILVSHQSRVKTERETLIAAIQAYKKAKGTYPSDNTNDPTRSPLFYELTGTVVTIDPSSNAPSKYHSPTTGEDFSVPDLQTIFGANCTGFANTTPDPTQVQNFFGAAAKSARTGQFQGPNGNYTLLGVPVTGPLSTSTLNGNLISPWSYVVTNPTNNTDSYDLWLDMTGSGRTYRISNWRRDPQPL